MENHYDVIVLGVGSMGAATCWALSRRGLKVLGLERYSVPHRMGSHHGETRMIRQAYFEHPDYVRLLHHAYAAWRDLEEETGESLLHTIGGLYMGFRDGDLVQGAALAAEQHKLPHEWLSPSEVQERFPAFRCPNDWVGLFEPSAGYVRCESAISAMAVTAMRRGVSIRACEAVNKWSSDGRSVTVTTERDVYRAERLIVCGGAWAGELLSDLDLQLSVTRQVVLWLWPEQPKLVEPGRLPVWAIDPEPAGKYRGIYYGFPSGNHPPGLKLGWHAPGTASEPHEVDRNLRPEDLAWVADFARDLMPAAGQQILGGTTCLYTYSRDGHFVLDQHPSFANVHFAAGFSGHGFKFSPVIGQVLAEWSLEGHTRYPVDFLALKRFSRPTT